MCAHRFRPGVAPRDDVAHRRDDQDVGLRSGICRVAGWELTDARDVESNVRAEWQRERDRR